MKKIIHFLVALLAFVMLPVFAFCQEVTTVPGFDPGQYFASLSAMVAAVMVITQFIKKLLTLKDLWAKILSWIVAALLSLAGWYFQYGIFIGTEWYHIILNSALIGLVSNGVFNIGVAESIKQFLKAFIKKE